jgi:hypothetical protein
MTDEEVGMIEEEEEMTEDDAMIDEREKCILLLVTNVETAVNCLLSLLAISLFSVLIVS